MKFMIGVMICFMVFTLGNAQSTQNDYTGLPEAVKTAVAHAVASLHLHPIAKVGAFGYSNEQSPDAILSKLVFGEIEKALMFYGDIQVITRSDIHWIKEEKDFLMNLDMDDLNERQSIELGKIVGVDYIIIAHIYGETYNLRRIQIRILNVKTGRVEGSSSQGF